MITKRCRKHHGQQVELEERTWKRPRIDLRGGYIERTFHRELKLLLFQCLHSFHSPFSFTLAFLCFCLWESDSDSSDCLVSFFLSFSVCESIQLSLSLKNGEEEFGFLVWCVWSVEGKSGEKWEKVCGGASFFSGRLTFCGTFSSLKFWMPFFK